MGANLWIDIGSQGTSLDQFPNRFTAKSMTGSGKDQPRDSTWFFVTDETDGDCRDTRICCFCRLYRWAKQQIAVSPASVSTKNPRRWETARSPALMWILNLGLRRYRVLTPG